LPERVVRGNGIRRGRLYIDAQHVTEQRGAVLPMILRIAARPAISHADVQHSVRAEHHQAAVVVAEWLIDEQYFQRGRCVRNIAVG
jgi:hypothetical protein